MAKEIGFSKILVAVDGSDASMKAAEYGIAMAKKHDAKLLVVTALDIPYAELYLSEIGNYHKYAKKKAKEDAEKWFDEIRKMAKASNVKVESDIIEPSPNIAGSIVNYADHKNIELIVLGTRGKSGFKRLLLGSVASGVVTYATCSVMVIK